MTCISNREVWLCGVMCVFSVSRFDIKGCEVSRWTEPAPEGSQIIVVLKDLNFEGQYITLGKESQWDVYVFWDVALLHPLQASHYIVSISISVMSVSLHSVILMNQYWILKNQIKKIQCEYMSVLIFICYTYCICLLCISAIWVIMLRGVFADQQRPWLLQQVEIDTHFLQRLNVLDYSLLLAHQPLQQDERHQSLSFATLIMRTKKSVLLISFLFIYIFVRITGLRVLI